MAPGESLAVGGNDPNLAMHLAAWARHLGHRAQGTTVTKGSAAGARWSRSERAGGPSPTEVWEKAPRRWGLAARGALVEAGGPDLSVADLDTKPAIWSDLAPRLYAQATAAQWDPATAIDWNASITVPDEVEAAVVQVMTYLIENEQAALMVPARFLGRVHPHYREVAQFLAVQTADEARHIEVFSRRAVLVTGQLGVSGAGGRASLQSLLDEPEFSVASFLLSVLGEGTFLHLLSFLERYAPDVVTAQVCHLALQDEARHVAFGLGHLEEQVRTEPSLRPRLRLAMQRRHDALASTSGLNENVLDALVMLAAGGWTPEAIGRGHDAVQQLQADMDEGRRRRLSRLGYSPREAEELSALHTRNFM
ncbi:MAG: ferritin-like domain-containing protein [Actinomycetota bacterium]|nr:ferritin-like domain-containing protein [Actinomycetota bacterium]